ncbi:cytochrome P450 [Trichoderma aethiopicum]
MGVLLGSDVLGVEPPVKLSLALPLAVVALGFGYFVWTCIYNVFFHPLRKFPGPKLAAISRIPYSRMLLNGVGHREVLDLHIKYGPIVRVAPDFLCFSHPNAMNDIRGHRKAGQPEHRKDPLRQEMNVHNIIGADRHNHTRFRRALANGFSHQAMLDQEPIISDYIEQLMEALERQAEGGSKPVDMVRWFNYTTFDVIGDLAFGESFGCLQSSNYDPWIQLLFDSVKTLVWLGTLKHFEMIPRWIIKYIMPKGLERKYAENQRLSTMKVQKRLDTGSERPDFITSMTAKRNGESLTFEELAANASILIIAGSETTATALSAVAYFLSLNLEAQAKLAQEVRSMFNSPQEITITSVQHLTYMLAVIDEAMRLYPPVVAGLTRLISEGGAVVAGEYVPEGTYVEVWQWPLFHNPSYWKKPEEFIPERWLGDPMFADDKREAFQPFSTGPRNCVGKNLAYSEMRLILARVIFQYDLKAAEGTEGWDYRSKAFTLWSKGPVNVYLTPRKMV